MNNSFLKECLKFNKENFKQAYTTFEKYQEHSEKITENLFNFPVSDQFGGQGKELIDQWKNLYKEGQQNIKKMMEETFSNFEKIIQ